MLLNSTIPANSDRWGLFWANAWVASAIEVLFALLISNLAVLVSVFVYNLIQPSQLAGWSVGWETVRSSIKTTEIIGYILGFIAPAMWVIVKNLRLWRHLGFLFTLLFIHGIVLLSTAVILALAIAQTLKNSELASQWVGWCLVIALTVWYSTLVYQKKVLDGLDRLLHKPAPGKESGSDVLANLKAQS